MRGIKSLIKSMRTMPATGPITTIANHDAAVTPRMSLSRTESTASSQTHASHTDAQVEALDDQVSRVTRAAMANRVLAQVIELDEKLVQQTMLAAEAGRARTVFVNLFSAIVGEGAMMIGQSGVLALVQNAIDTRAAKQAAKEAKAAKASSTVEDQDTNGRPGRTTNGRSSADARTGSMFSCL